MSANFSTYLLTAADYLPVFLLAGLATLSMLGFAGAYWFIFDIAGQFRLHYFIAAIAMVIWFGLLANWVLLAVAGSLALLNMLPIVPFYYPPFRAPPVSPRQPTPRRFRLFLANILRSNRRYHLLLEQIQETTPDLIALVEPDQDWLDALEILRTQYPYWYDIPRLDNYGLAILSRTSFSNTSTILLTDQGVPSLLVETVIDNQSLTVILSHPPPPKSSWELRYRDQQLHKLGECVRDLEPPVLLCGDFNCAPWMDEFRQMQRTAGLKDSSAGLGYKPTWPAGRLWSGVPIDHCLYTGSLRVASRSLGEPIGSDHLPLIVDFFLQPFN